MSSDDNPETQRASSGDNLRDNLRSSTPILYSVRRRPTTRGHSTLPAPNSSGAPGRIRPSNQHLSRYHGLVEPRTEANADAFDLWNHWQSAAQNTQEDERRIGTGPNNHPLSPLAGGQFLFREPEESGLRELLDFTNNVSSENYHSRAPRHGLHEDNRRTKRRKLDSDRLVSNFQGFQYGKYGQVQPGQLTMELVGCDGGIYSDDTTKYAAENILRNDDSVYCTEGPRCNIVLRHQGATVFTLKELVIKAPRSNYTSPVQEGMVFVSMTSDHILNRTTQYQIQYTHPRSASRRQEREMEPLHPIISIRHNEDGSTMTRAQARARRLYNLGLDEEDDDLGVAQLPSEFNVFPPPFQVTTECSDDDETESWNVRQHGRTPNRIGSLPFESDSENDTEQIDLSIEESDYRPQRRRNRSSTALDEAAEAAQSATQEANRAVGGELMTPHARFYIERNKSRCTIRFDPPVSGRYILLKMWNPRRNPQANIDIQAVVAKGFAGPRFFPSIEVR